MPYIFLPDSGGIKFGRDISQNYNSGGMNSFWNWHQNVPWNSQEWNATGIQSLEYSLIKFILISTNVRN